MLKNNVLKPFNRADTNMQALPLHSSVFITSEDIPGGPGLLKAQSVVWGHQGFQLLGSGHILADLREVLLHWLNLIMSTTPYALHPRHMVFIEKSSFQVKATGV